MIPKIMPVLFNMPQPMTMSGDLCLPAYRMKLAAIFLHEHKVAARIYWVTLALGTLPFSPRAHLTNAPRDLRRVLRRYLRGSESGDREPTKGD